MFDFQRLKMLSSSIQTGSGVATCTPWKQWKPWKQHAGAHRVPVVLVVQHRNKWVWFHAGFLGRPQLLCVWEISNKQQLDQEKKIEQWLPATGFTLNYMHTHIFRLVHIHAHIHAHIHMSGLKVIDSPVLVTWLADIWMETTSQMADACSSCICKSGAFSLPVVCFFARNVTIPHS